MLSSLYLSSPVTSQRSVISVSVLLGVVNAAGAVPVFVAGTVVPVAISPMAG